MRRPLFWVCLFLCFASALHFFLTERSGLPGADPPIDGGTVLLEGRVCGKGSAGRQDYFLIQIIDSLANQNAASTQQIFSYLQQFKTERLQCYPAVEMCEGMPEIGSRVRIRGQFGCFSDASNPGEFSPSDYYRSSGIGGKLTRVEILEEKKALFPMGEWMYRLRGYFGRRLDEIFPEREAGVLRTMLLGDRSELDAGLKELYRSSGIIHILSISGLHISLLGMGLYRLLRRLGAAGGVSSVCAGLFLVLYGMMTGMSVSACRAIGMFLLRMISVLWGRTYDLLTALALLGAGMLCLQPLYLLHSGFWLSFGSLAAVGGILPVLERLAEDGQETGPPYASEACRLSTVLRGIWKAAAGGLRSGMAVILATLPLQLRFYYEVPVYSMLVNLLVLPAMGPVVGCGFLAMLVPGLGFLGLLDVVVLRCFELLCSLVRKIPFHTWNPGCPEIWQILLYYFLLALVLGGLVQYKQYLKEHRIRGIPLGYRPYGGEKREKKATAAVGRKEGTGDLGSRGLEDTARSNARGLMDELGDEQEMFTRKVRCLVVGGYLGKWFLLFLPVLILALPVHRITGITFLDVGQGDAVCIRTARGSTWIYDCGSTGKSKVGENILIPFLKHEGIRHLDGVIISHGDRDHISGLLELFRAAKQEGIRINHVVLPYLGQEDVISGTMDGYYDISEAMDCCFAPGEKRERTHVMTAGDEIKGPGIRLLALNPSGRQKEYGMVSEDGNASSLCLYVELERGGEKMTALLTGDVEAQGEENLIREMKQRELSFVNILKCAHHGSKNATSEAFLKQLDMQIAVISCGRNNSYGHPHGVTLDRLEAEGVKVLRTDELGAIEIKWKSGGNIIISGQK